MTIQYLAILQARCSSRRLPGKVLKPILGQPMLQHHISRIRRSRRISHLVLATSADASDDPIAGLARDIKVDCFRGSLDNVLARFHGAATEYQARNIVRLTGDCPLADWDIIDRVIDLHRERGSDFTSNTLERTFPRGLDLEVFTFACLDQTYAEATSSYEREHVTPYILSHKERFNFSNLKADQNLSHLRWTVDEPDDFLFVKTVYEKLYPVNPQFKTKDVLELLNAEPALQTINQHVKQEGENA